MPSGHRPPIPPGYARVALLGTTFTHLWTNIFYVQLTGSGILASDLNTLASDIAGSWNTNVAPDVPNTVVLTNVEIVYVPSVGNEVTGIWSGTHAGSLGTVQVLDASACYVVNWIISAYYRGGHPRWYVPGVNESAVTNGSDIGSSYQSSIASAFGALRTAVNGFTTTNISGVSMGTMSYQQGNAWRATPLFRPFTGVKVRAKLGSQRRRILS